MRRTAALIVGGGPAGSAAAIILARGGIVPELVERTRAAHDVVCGGFLGWDALAALQRLGVNAGALGGNPIHRLRLVAAERQVEVKLPGAAMGLSRRTLDAALLSAASSAGAIVTRGRAARTVDPEARCMRLDDGEEIGADALFLATGKHDLRGAARPLEHRSEQPSVGLRTALPASSQLQASLSGTIELHLFDKGYAGLLLQEDGTANLCLSVGRGRLSRAGSIAKLVAELGSEAPLLGARISGGLWQTIAGVPYGWKTRDTVPGLFRLGDQSAVIASLAGDGVAIALESGAEAAYAFLRHGPQGAQAYQKAFARRSALPLTIADALRHAAENGRSRTVLMRLAAVPGLARLAAKLTRIE